MNGFTEYPVFGELSDCGFQTVFPCFAGFGRGIFLFFTGNFAVCIDKSGGMGYDYSGGYFINVTRCVLRKKCMRFL
ncbi:MAG: hypothetical protein K2N72_06980 [Oscillospiraceae bacterium]|nr:hypothetical protein [Oscillospiraceae bacterium]